MRFLDSTILKSTTNEAGLDAKFLQENGDKYHQALGVKAHYNEVTTWFEEIPDSPYSKAEDDLQIALYEYNKTTEEKYRLDLDSYTLDEVLLEIAEADGRYNEKEKGIAGAHRYAGRFAGNNADALLPWLELIPNDHGMSVLAGGLKAILNKILGALHEIPDVMFQTQKQQEVFSAVPKIRNQAIYLYKILAHCLAYLITTLNPSRSKEKFREKAKRLGKKFIPYRSAAEIDGLLGDVETSVGKFRDCLQLVRDEYIVATHENSRVILDQGSIIQENTENMGEQLEHIRQDMKSLKRCLDASRIEQQIRHSHAVNSQNFFLGFVRSDPPALEAPFLASSYISQPQYLQPFLTDTDLFDAIGVQVHESIEDVERILKHRDQFDIAAQTQAQQLLSSEQFMGWMKSPLPETLFVKGHFQMVGPGRISVLSALFATLSLNLIKNTDYVVLHAFCGLHEAQSHQSVGPNWLIRSLIAQLLLSGINLNLDCINTRAFAEGIKSHHLQDLCSIFRLLIEQLPNTVTVICIIDGVNRFESEIWKADMIEILFILNQIVLNESLRPAFKLLLATPFSNTRFVENPNTIWSHYTVNLRPTAVTSGRRISERGLFRGRSLEEYRARLQQKEQNLAQDSDGEENSDSDDDDIVLFF
ncbi:hypothetical protein N7533_005228 [Penicillium manginii]|uniref:uncharacterized protein n=1 Tax=Penicillium manginii TaxID=203109 RepID=UPI002547D455|nr:uncharacterized protein N7533_005228 [Penicillium manginii]KAJ5755685.1 hypothetical protein N7533_005228 [Penicillium manginii]